MIRRKKRQSTQIIDPFDLIAADKKRVESILGNEATIISNNTEAMHKALLDTQRQITESWEEAESILPNASEQSAPPQAENETSPEEAVDKKSTKAIDQMLQQEQELTAQKLQEISAHSKSIIAVLEETQKNINALWLNTEQLVAKSVTQAPSDDEEALVSSENATDSAGESLDKARPKVKDNVNPDSGDKD